MYHLVSHLEILWGNVRSPHPSSWWQAGVPTAHDSRRGRGRRRRRTSATTFLTKGGRPLGTPGDALRTVPILYYSSSEVQCSHTHTPCNVAEARHGWDREGDLHCSIQRPPPWT